MAEVKLDGVDVLLHEIRRKLETGAERVERKALKAAGEVMAESMRSKVNVSDLEYVHMRDDIKVSRVIRKDGMKYVLIGPGRKTGWRGHFLEFGTTKMSARPFVEPAYHEKKGEAMQILADELRKGLSS